MTRKAAIDKLMFEWKASASFRPFFERAVNAWMGDAKNILESDMEGIRDMIRKMM